MKFLKLQTEILKDWFDFRTKGKPYKWTACEIENGFCVSDNKVLVHIPRELFMLRLEATPYLSPRSAQKVSEVPSDTEIFEKTGKMETYADVLAVMFEPRQGDGKPIALNKKYLDYFDSDCIVKGTTPNHPVFIYEREGENEVFRAILMPVMK